MPSNAPISVADLYLTRSRTSELTTRVYLRHFLSAARVLSHTFPRPPIASMQLPCRSENCVVVVVQRKPNDQATTAHIIWRHNALLSGRSSAQRFVENYHGWIHVQISKMNTVYNALYYCKQPEYPLAADAAHVLSARIHFSMHEGGVDARFEANSDLRHSTAPRWPALRTCPDHRPMCQVGSRDAPGAKDLKPGSTGYRATVQAGPKYVAFHTGEDQLCSLWTVPNEFNKTATPPASR